MNEYPKRQLAKHSLISRMAAEIKHAYVVERRLWKGSRNGDQQRYEPPRRLEDSWRTYAERLLNEAIFDCRAFTRLQFRHSAAASLCPEPRVCYGPKAISRWRKFCEDSRGEVAKEIRLSLRLNLDYYQTSLQQAQSLAQVCRWSPTETARQALMDRTSPVSALFRYCYAYKQQFHDIADFYFDAALFDYLFARRHYDEIWSEAITDELRSTADDVCSVARDAVHVYGGK